MVHRHPEQYLHKSRFTRYLQYFRDGGPSYMMMVSKHHASSVGFPDSGGVGGVGGGDDDDIGTQTSRTISPYFRDGRPSEMMMVSTHHASSVGFPDSGGVGWGVWGGDDDDIGTQTPLTTSPQEPFYSVFTVLSY